MPQSRTHLDLNPTGLAPGLPWVSASKAGQQGNRPNVLDVKFYAVLDQVRDTVEVARRRGRGAGPGVHKDREFDVVGHQIDRRIHCLTRRKQRSSARAAVGQQGGGADADDTRRRQE